MQVKAFEIRDAKYFIPALGVLMVPRLSLAVAQIPASFGKQTVAERYLLRRAGLNFEQPLVLLCRMEAAGTSNNATYDPYSWGNRTMHEAHLYITAHWGELESGAVIDVEHILGLTPNPKQSERETASF